jgi:hypothetical protein
MPAIPRLERLSAPTAGLAGSIVNSTFARYRTAEMAAEERMRRQREARLERLNTDTLQPTAIPFIRSMRFPQRWIEE